MNAEGNCGNQYVPLMNTNQYGILNALDTSGNILTSSYRLQVREETGDHTTGAQGRELLLHYFWYRYVITQV